MPTQTLQQFGQTIKAKHPEYADMSDEEVGQKVLAKYPQYSDMVSNAPTTAAGLPLGTRPAGLPAGVDLPGLPSAPPPTMTVPPGAQHAATLLQAGRNVRDVAKGAGEGGLSTVLNLNNLVQNHTGAFGRWAGLTPEQQAELRSASTPDNTAQTIGKVGEQVGEFFIPGPAEEATTAKLAELAPKLKTVAKIGTAALGAGAVNKAQGGSFGAGAAGGAVGAGIGQGLQALAPGLAESALGVRGADRMYGRTVGDAILNDTRGFAPEAVTRTARETVGNLVPQLESSAADAGAAGSRGSLLPARQAVSDKIGTLTTQRAVNSAAELQPLGNFLNTDQVTGLPLSPTQSPTGLLNLKRGLDNDFIGNWNPTKSSRVSLETAKNAYGALADQFHAAAPGTNELDQRISSLIPVIDRGQRTALNAGVPEMVLHSLRAPTGALAGTLGGAYEGEKQGGLKGAVIGGAIGAIAPKLISSPTFLTGVARGSDALAPSFGTLTNAALQQYMRPSGKDKEKGTSGAQ